VPPKLFTLTNSKMQLTFQDVKTAGAGFSAGEDRRFVMIWQARGGRTGGRAGGRAGEQEGTEKNARMRVDLVP